MNADDMLLFFKQIKAPMYAVLGNHDSYYGKEDVAQMLQKAGVVLLDNQSVPLVVNKKRITIAGTADFYTDAPDVSKALQNEENAILLTHSPDALPLFENHWGQIGLVLAGHTHGGQIVLPVVGAPVVPLDNDKSLRYGLFYRQKTPLIITKGLGTSLLPMRFNCSPEIVVIDFK